MNDQNEVVTVSEVREMIKENNLVELATLFDDVRDSDHIVRKDRSWLQIQSLPIKQALLIRTMRWGRCGLPGTGVEDDWQYQIFN